MLYVEQLTDKFYKLYKCFLPTKIKKTKSSYKSELKMSFSSPALLSVESNHSPV